MSNKFHINKNGEVRPCPALLKCRLGGEHFDTREEAYEYAQKELEKEYSLLAEEKKNLRDSLESKAEKRKIRDEARKELKKKQRKLDRLEKYFKEEILAQKELPELYGLDVDYNMTNYKEMTLDEVKAKAPLFEDIRNAKEAKRRFEKITRQSFGSRNYDIQEAKIDQQIESAENNMRNAVRSLYTIVRKGGNIPNVERELYLDEPKADWDDIKKRWKPEPGIPPWFGNDYQRARTEVDYVIDRKMENIMEHNPEFFNNSPNFRKGIQYPVLKNRPKGGMSEVDKKIEDYKVRIAAAKSDVEAFESANFEILDL